MIRPTLTHAQLVLGALLAIITILFAFRHMRRHV